MTEESEKPKPGGCGCLWPLIGLMALIAAFVLVPLIKDQQEQRRLHADDEIAVVDDVRLVDPQGIFALGEQATLENSAGVGRVTVSMAVGDGRNRSPLAEVQLHYRSDSVMSGQTMTCETDRSHFWSSPGDVTMTCGGLIIDPSGVDYVTVLL